MSVAASNATAAGAAVAILRRDESGFADAIERLLANIGVPMIRTAPYDDDDGQLTPDFLDKIGQLAAQCRVAVAAVESEQIVDRLDARVAQPSAAFAAALGALAVGFGSDRLVMAAQSGDPYRGLLVPGREVRLSDDADPLVDALEAAGLVLPPKVRQKHLPAADFDFAEDWWSWPFDQGGAAPSFTEFLVDSVFNRQLTQSKLNEEAIAKIRDKKELDLKYHYVGWKSAQNWDRLARDTTYSHDEHVQKIVSTIPDVVSHIHAASEGFNYVSLGPGDGSTDVAILPVLAKFLRIHSFFLVDVSIELLQIATNRVITEVMEPSDLEPPRIRAVLGDFEDSLAKLAPVMTESKVPNLFSLLGFTIGNASEAQVLDSLSRGMRTGDYLLFDVRLHSSGELPSDFVLTKEAKEQLIAPYVSEAMKKFAFGPVEEVADYLVRLGDPEIRIEYDAEREQKFTTVVDNAINVYIQCAGLYGNDDVRERVGLPRLRPYSARKRRDEANLKLRLVTLTFYDIGSLDRWITGIGVFKVRWRTEKDGVGIFLLEKLEKS